MSFKNGKIKVVSLVLALALALTVIPGIALAADVSPELQAAYDALVIHNADDIRESVSLPSVGENGASIDWTSSDESVVSTKEIENKDYFPAPAGVVTRGDRDVNVTLTATISLGGESVDKVFDLNVKAAPKGDVSLMEVNNSDDGAYLFFYFTDNGTNEQQIFLASSVDGLRWKELNDRKPILTSSLETGGVRDPFIIRSYEGDKFYLIATDLDIAKTNWNDAQYKGSKGIMIWESNDLVNWSKQRFAVVSTLPEQGCTWAPEVIYDKETNEYVLFWSSKMTDTSNPRYTMQSVYYATTRDFYNFSTPEMFIAGTRAMTGHWNEAAGEKPEDLIPVIDTTILQSEDDGRYYRVTKHELVSKVFMESSKHLRTGYTTVDSNLYTDSTFAGVEGPELYRLEDGRYCLLLDRFGNGGYMPVITRDLAGGQFETIKDHYMFPVARHGGVLRITNEEYDRVMAKYYTGAPAVTPDEDGSGPIIAYDFEDGTAADAVGDNDATLNGSAKVIDDETMGKVLSLDGTNNSCMELPRGVLDGRNELTVSMDVYNTTTGNYFNFTIGQDNIRYLFTKLMDNGVKLALTSGSNVGEESAERYIENMNGVWKNVTFTASAKDELLRLYIDGRLYAEMPNMCNTISDLGKDTMSYIGKSFWGNDKYASMMADNVEIYNRVLSDEEIFEKYAPAPVGNYSLSVDASERGANVTEGTVGLFFEDLSTAADGGIYSEAVNNRSFEAVDAKGDRNNPVSVPSYGWSTVGGAKADYSSAAPLNDNNTTYLTLTATAAGDGIENNCYAGDGNDSRPLSKGMNVVKGGKYNASVFLRGNYDGNVTMQVVDGNTVIGDVTFDKVTGDFTKMTGVITAIEDCDDARVRVVLSKAGTVDLDMVSLIPQATFNGRDNGLRADLVEKLANLRPGFVRFPGGCIIEGYNLDNRYQWKHTVGPVEQRIQNWNRWQTEGTYNYAYCQTYGLGFYEYFLLCEDLGADPVPVLNVGLACQYQSAEASSKDDLYDIYIQDALDLIEFANDDPDADWTKYDYSKVDTAKPETFGGNWANLRALMGHPDSFNMTYMGIGNEQFDTSDYSEGKVDGDGWANNGNNFFFRYEAFEEAIHKVDPDMKLISTSGPSSDDNGDQYAAGSRGGFSKAWSWTNDKLKDNPDFAYAVDEHYYKQPDWFLANVNRYDVYDRDGAGVFAGEYASRWWEELRGNTWEAALSEAAYMTGLERNSDVVKMASFAPLFAKEGGYQWSPNMIWFNNAESYGTPDYYVQEMYSRNSGDYNVKTALSDTTDDYDGIAGVGTWRTSAIFTDFTVVNDDTGEVIPTDGWNTENTTGWNIEDGSATQTLTNTQDANAYIFANMEPITARNFTITVKATKTGGAEGFIIPVLVKDRNNLIHWNVGGWNNAKSAFEKRVNGYNTQVSDDALPISSDGKVLVEGQQYELKVVAKNGTLFGFIDGRLVNTYRYDADPVYANSVKDEETGDIIVKLVNSSSNRVELPITINNASLTGYATQYLMTGEFRDKNSIGEPRRVAPVRSEIKFSSGDAYMLPAYSFVVLRFHTDGAVGVSEVESVNVQAALGDELKLPGKVTVYTSEGGESQRDVQWILPSAGVFANAGSFKVFGRVNGSELDAVAYVTVTDEASGSVIETNVDTLLSGEETVVTFNAPEPDAYNGILAVYGEDGLVSVQTVRFTGVSGAMRAKLGDLDGKTVKIMLWIADEMTPVTDGYLYIDPAVKE